MAANKILTQLANIMTSPSYADRIPKVTQDKITANGFGTAGTYTPDDYNAIYGAMLNMVAKIQTFAFKYHGIDFDKYNKGFISYGDAIIDYYIDIADVGTIPKLINDKGDNGGVSTVDPYKIKWGSVKQAYYVGTFDLQYQMTTRLYEVQKAFISDGGVTNFISKMKSVLPESLKYDRYLIFRNMLASESIYAVKKDFKVTPVNDDEPVLTADQAIMIASQIKNYVSALKRDTRTYNKLGVMAGADSEDLVLFMNEGIYNAMKTAVKNVYHNEIDFGVSDIEFIPDFGEKALTTGQFASLLDKRGLYIWDTLRPYVWDIWNGTGLYWNTYLSYAGKIAYALHRQSVMFTMTEVAPNPPTGG